MTEIKEPEPCPFCGHEPEVFILIQNGIEYVKCSNSDCFLYDLDGTTIEHWNTREHKSEMENENG